MSIGEKYTFSFITQKCVEIEEQLSSKYKGDSYLNRVLELVHNLKDKENEELREKILEEKIKPEELILMDTKSLANKKVKEKIEQKTKENFEEMQNDWLKNHSQASEGIYTCKRCGGKKTIQTEMQTRSADEPMTIFVSCLTCGNSWKFS